MAERMEQSLWAPDKRYPVGSGVYLIRCTTNGRIYIGSSIDLAERLSRHFTMLRGGRHENRKLQNHFNKYGEEAFECCLLESTGKEDMAGAEQAWIDRYWPTKRLMNTQRSACRPPLFDELPEDVRERKREKHKRPTGRAASPKLLAHLAQRVGANNPNFGKKWSHEQRAKRSAWIEKHGPVGAKKCVRLAADGTLTVWPSATAAASDLGKHVSVISVWVSGKKRPRDGSVWRYEK